MSTPIPTRSTTSFSRPALRQGRSRWPAPTTHKPDMELLAAWYFDRGGSEATDGCWVEIDGVCPHGHPSWFIQYGMIEG